MPRAEPEPRRGGNRGRGARGRARFSTSSSHHSAPATASAPVVASAPLPAPIIDPAATTEARFADLARDGLVDAQVISAITDGLGYQTMTAVQEATIRPLLDGKDCLAKAKTGTGKTIAFLVPSIQAILQNTDVTKNATHVRTLIISPTRELALQIATEAKALLTNYSKIRVQTFIGGTNMKTETNSFLGHNTPQIVVATPGRLQDHLSSNPEIKARFQAVDFLTLDEADRLLEQGFKSEIDQIQSHLPSPSQHPRQTLFFSATVPPRVTALCQQLLAPGYRTISTVSEDDVDTHSRIPQFVMSASIEDQIPATLALITKLKAEGPVKAVLFYPTARGTGVAHDTFTSLARPPIPASSCFEIHSRKSQSNRTKTAEAFKQADQGLLFSSDVSARGMDFPNVTHVIQVGLPSSGEDYVHRLGRTGRAGKEGQGYLLLDRDEQFFVRKELKGLPISADPALQQDIDNRMDESRQAVGTALTKVDPVAKGQAYQAWLGYYTGYSKDMGWSKEGLVRRANEYAIKGLGWTANEPPMITPKALGFMNLKPWRHLLNVGDVKSGHGPGGGGGGRGGGGYGRGGRGGGQQSSSRGRGGQMGGQQGPRRFAPSA